MSGLCVIEAAREPGVANRVALITADTTWRYGELSQLTALCRERFRREGIEAGGRVAILSPNRLGAVVAIHALLSLGAVLVPLHPRLTATEAEALIEDARPTRVLREADLVALESALGDAVRAGAVAGPWWLTQPAVEVSSAVEVPSATEVSPAVEVPQAAEVPAVVSGEVVKDDAAEEGDLAILYTSGTTGRAKGAVLSRRAFVAAAVASAENLGFHESDRWLLCMPLCHVGGLSVLTRCLLARRAMILVERFEPQEVLRAIVRDRATLLSVVPTMLAALVEADPQHVLARLRAVLVGGAGAPQRLLEICARRRVPVLTTYGLTEACSQVTSQAPRDASTQEPGSGRPLGGSEVRLVDVDDAGAGRIQVRSATLFRGYWRGPERAPEHPLDAEGWFDTGDLGRLDDAGRLHVLARRTDLVVTGGENVYPAEVERALEGCEGVSRALVFGVPDERWGQLVAAAVVLDPAAPKGAPEVWIASETSARLASHKRPRLLAVVDALPVTPAGKPDRRGAAERLAAKLRPLPRR
ncbi:class I adenylate-forming enzyme family protein [Chondromyces crocatus]|uniref:O-succinylbenzoate-CoA ligase n=1 Tax=Chondromyces crocatus TaxID=52 RepID=A0A0K1EHQ2_CHOCO|nr:class I adenylate-forming enzyme family protein [Chondromyces crocatus]AKT40207.1 O-succinylbenzoate-CoA ligase [Chondromyces crocatus]